jgi:L-rhamnose isomerase
MKTVEQVQFDAIQQALVPYGLAHQFSGGKMNRGMKVVMAEAQKRGVTIQSQGDLTRQAIQALGEIAVGMARVYARTLLAFGEIEQRLQGTPHEADMVSFNGELIDLFRQQVFTIFQGSSLAMHPPLMPIRIEEPERTWLQRLLRWDGD